MQKEVRDQLKEKYERIFHVFQAKPINFILSNGKTEVAITYYDLRFDSDDAEYLKRYYMSNESLVRIQKLINYYKDNMAGPSPSFVPIQPFQTMTFRHRRKIKLLAQREQSLARKFQEQKQQQNMENMSKDNILHHLSVQNLSDLQIEDNAHIDSFDSDVHDIYNDHTLESKVRMAFSSNGPETSILDIRSIKQSQLIIDFKQPHRQQPSYRTNPNSEDTYPYLQISQKNKQKYDKKPAYLNIASPDKKEQNKNSFIGYYNSLQKKQPSKILQQYLKQKK